MAALVWDQVSDRLYETGVSKGVLYKADGYGVPWNGLTAIEEGADTEIEPIHYDGIKINNIITLGDFSAVLRAFTYPHEFLYYEGTLQQEEGFYIMNQPQSQFGLSYQTRIGDEVSGLEAGYKIHLLYNLTAIPSQRTYETLSMDVEPMEFEWEITSIPSEIENFRPTAHVAFNSLEMDPNILKDIEDILYGNEDRDAILPSLNNLTSFIRKWARLIITDYGDGTWSADAKDEGVITMINSTTFQIIADTATFIDANSYTISSSDKNEEDIWPP